MYCNDDDDDSGKLKAGTESAQNFLNENSQEEGGLVKKLNFLLRKIAAICLKNVV